MMSPRAKRWLLKIGIAGLILVAVVSALAISELTRIDRMQREIAARRQQWLQLRHAALVTPEPAIR